MYALKNARLKKKTKLYLYLRRMSDFVVQSATSTPDFCRSDFATTSSARSTDSGPASASSSSSSSPDFSSSAVLTTSSGGKNRDPNMQIQVIEGTKTHQINASDSTSKISKQILLI